MNLDDINLPLVVSFSLNVGLIIVLSLRQKACNECARLQDRTIHQLNDIITDYQRKKYLARPWGKHTRE